MLGVTAGAIFGGLRNTKFLIQEFDRLGPDYPVARLIRQDYEELYSRGGAD